MFDIPAINYILTDDEFVNKTLKELYFINDLEYENKALAELDLSTRITNRLQGVLGVHSIGEMLNLTYGQLVKLKGFGKNSIIGIDDALRLLAPKNNYLSKNEKKECFSHKNKILLKNHLMEICHNNFTILNMDSFNDAERALLDSMKEAVEFIDGNLLMASVKETEHILPILNLLNSMVSNYNKKEKIREQIKKEYVHVSDNKRDIFDKYTLIYWIQESYDLIFVFFSGDAFI